MLTAFGQSVVLIGSVAVLTVCVVVCLALLARLWRDCRPSQWHEFWYTAFIVLFFGAIAGLCGFGAYTIAHAAAFELAGMLNDVQYLGGCP